METVGEVIERNHAQILRTWTQRTQQVTSARGLTASELTSMMPAYLSLLGHHSLTEGTEQLTQAQNDLVEHHLSTRLRQGFELNDILGEFATLSGCLTRILDAEPDEQRPPIPDIAQLFTELYLTSLAVTRIFTEHLLEDEQTEKRCRRRLQQLARGGGPHDSAAALRKRLDESLTVIMDGLAAQSAALLLYDAKSGQLIMSASVGDAHEPLAAHVSSLDASTFAGRIASRQDETTAVSDVATTELAVSDTLRRSGIHSLLGVRLSAGHALRGVVYIGIRERRAFSASEVRRLEDLGATLTIHLDNAQLHATLRKKVDELGAEAALREPVHLAAHARSRRAAGQRAAHRAPPRRRPRAAGAEPRPDLQHRRQPGAGRADAGDLLDTHRVRAGQPLPVTFADCNLAAIARSAVRGVCALHGDRVVVHADKPVRGMWNEDQLSRAIWNLCTNAIRFGAAGTAVIVSVKGGPDGAELSVHNEGPPIAADEQEKLFRPFAQTRAAIDGHPRGWGLGLTLVWACAEAHGGRVSARSVDGAGTTFTLSLPYDARPYAMEG